MHAILEDVPGTTPLACLRPAPRPAIMQAWFVNLRWRLWGDRVVALSLDGDAMLQSLLREAFCQHMDGR